MTQDTALEVAEDGDMLRLRPVGDWTVLTLSVVADELTRLRRDERQAEIDISGIDRLDTSGALMLARCGADPDGEPPVIVGKHEYAAELIAEAAQDYRPEPTSGRREWGLMPLFERTGRGLYRALDEAYDTLAFLGRTLVAMGKMVVAPHKFRWTATFNVMEHAGLNAMPIIAILAFFIGAVVAFIGLNLLAQFGVQIFAVELVGIAVLREFGALITAIMLAGRSDSAFTAQIGSMRMQQEIDAMKVMGLDPYDVLVAPRLLAIVLMAPILTFVAMMVGMLGGMIVIWAVIGNPPGFFMARMLETVGVIHFWAGMAKAPVFGVVIAIVGCRQGLNVEGDVESLGQRTTASVVQAIFLVIIIDAIFAMAYLELGI